MLCMLSVFRVPRVPRRTLPTAHCKRTNATVRRQLREWMEWKGPMSEWQHGFEHPASDNMGLHSRLGGLWSHRKSASARPWGLSRCAGLSALSQSTHGYRHCRSFSVHTDTPASWLRHGAKPEGGKFGHGGLFTPGWFWHLGPHCGCNSLHLSDALPPWAFLWRQVQMSPRLAPRAACPSGEMFSHSCLWNSAPPETATFTTVTAWPATHNAPFCEVTSGLLETVRSPP